METTKRPKTFDARDYYHALLKRKWLILTIAAVAGLAGGIYALSYQKRYKAVAWVIVYPEPQVFFWTPGEQRERGRQLSLETLASLAEGNDVATMTAGSLAARASGRRIIASAQEIAASVSARAVRPDRILIEAVHELKPNAIGFVNETAQSFVELSRDYRRAEDTAAVSFLEKQLKLAEENIDAALQAKQEKQEEWGIVSAEASQAAAANLNAYEAELARGDTEIAALDSQIASLEQELAELQNAPVSQQAVENPYRAILEGQLQTAMLVLGQLRARYVVTYPAVEQVELQVEELRQEIEREPPFIMRLQVVAQARVETVAQTLKSAKMQAAGLHARIGVLEQMVSRTRTKAMDLMAKEHSLSRDAYKAALYQATYEGMLQELRDRRLKEAAGKGTADVWDRALTATLIEVEPLHSALFTGMLGLVVGIAFALLAEILDTTINTPDDIARDTEVDFLGIIPLADVEPAQLVTISAPRSPAAEAYRTLRANINFAMVDEPAKTVMVTSAGAGEGKSLTVANLGVVLAQGGQSVLIVDSDLRRPIHYRLFDLDATPGLTSVLMGELSIEEALQDTAVENLRVMTSGPLPPNPAEMLDSARMASFISETLNHADIVFFDSPPSIMLADAIIMSAKVDCTILVAESGQVTSDAFNEMVRLMSRARGKILGVVLNKLDVSRAGYYYYYYYYYHYDYSRRTEEGEADESAAGAKGMPAESPIRPLNPQQAARFNHVSDDGDETSQ